MAVLSVARRSFKKLFTTHLLLTNTTSCSLLLGLGDAAQQHIQAYQSPVKKPYDWARTLRMAVMGLAMGPMNHYWYKILDGRLPGNCMATCIKKVFLDQMACPIFSLTFITGLGLLEGQSMKSAVKEYKDKFFQILALDWIVWPPTQYINFTFLSPQYRVLYISSVQLFYNCIISYIKHDGGFHGEHMPYQFE
jgi:protein Mpv17